MGEQPKAIEDMTVEELREECQRASREAYDAQRKVESLLRDRARWERAAAAAIRRNEREILDNQADFYAKADVQERGRSLDTVLSLVEQLGDRAGPKVVVALKDAAAAARSRIEWAKTPTPDTALKTAPAEVARLRHVITEQGQNLHKRQATGALPCRCDGCELIRSMDATAPSVEAALRTG